MGKDNLYILNLPPFDAKILETDRACHLRRVWRKYSLTPEEPVSQILFIISLQKKDIPCL